MSVKVAQMTVDELREMIGAVVEEKLRALLDDEDDLELTDELQERLFRQTKAIENGERGEALRHGGDAERRPFLHRLLRGPFAIAHRLDQHCFAVDDDAPTHPRHFALLGPLRHDFLDGRKGGFQLTRALGIRKCRRRALSRQ